MANEKIVIALKIALRSQVGTLNETSHGLRNESTIFLTLNVF